MNALKALIVVIRSLILLITPQIWAFAYIKAVLTVGFNNLDPKLNVVGICSVIVALNTIKAIILGIDKHMQKKSDPLA